MPHLIVEYSANIEDQIALDALLDKLHTCALGTGVFPIGGLREKVLAAARADIPKVIFPRENESDLEELPPETREELEFVPVDWIEEVLEVAFDGSLPKVAAPRPLSRERKAASGR